MAHDQVGVARVEIHSQNVSLGQGGFRLGATNKEQGSAERRGVMGHERCKQGVWSGGPFSQDPSTSSSRRFFFEGRGARRVQGGPAPYVRFLQQLRSTSRCSSRPCLDSCRPGAFCPGRTALFHPRSLWTRLHKPVAGHRRQPEPGGRVAGRGCRSSRRRRRIRFRACGHRTGARYHGRSEYSFSVGDAVQRGRPTPEEEKAIEIARPASAHARARQIGRRLYGLAIADTKRAYAAERAGISLDETFCRRADHPARSPPLVRQ